MKTMKKAFAFALSMALAASCMTSVLAPAAMATTEGKIQGFAWIDMNANGIRDTGEPAYPKIAVAVEQKINDAWQNVTAEANATNDEGNFAFNAPAGTYRVRFSCYDTKMYVPTEYQRDNGNYYNFDNDVKAGDQANTLLTEEFTLEAGQTTRPIGVGLKPVYGSIKGFAFKDVAPIDHKYTAGQDQLLANVDVELYKFDDPDNIFKLDGVEIKTTTDAKGEFSFKTVPAGDYTLRYKIPANHMFSQYNISSYTAGVDPKTDSKAIASTSSLQIGNSGKITVAVGSVIDSFNVGCYALNSISGMVFMDRNQDGARAETGEEGIPDYEVQLLKEDKTAVLDSKGLPIIVKTNASGKYYFGGLPAANYRLLFKKQMNCTYSDKQKAGVAVETNSDVDADGYTDVISLLASGSHYANVDAGAYLPGMGPAPTATPAEGEATPTATANTGKYGEMEKTGDSASSLFFPIAAGAALLLIGGGAVVLKKSKKSN